MCIQVNTTDNNKRNNYELLATIELKTFSNNMHLFAADHARYTD